MDLQVSCGSLKGATKAPKATRTLHCRIENYVEWCQVILIEPTLPCAKQCHRNKEMMFYALHVAHDNTILSTTIKSDTIKHYLKAASSISLNHKQLDPRLDEYGLEAQ